MRYKCIPSYAILMTDLLPEKNRSTFLFYPPAEALDSPPKKSHDKYATHTMALRPSDNSAGETK